MKRPLIWLFTLPLILTLAPVRAQDADAPEQETPEGVTVTIRKNRAPVAHEVLKVRFPKPKTYTLKNGLRVYILEDRRVPGADFSLMVKAGSMFYDKPEVAEAAGRQLMEGTTVHSAMEISRIVDGMGAEMHTGAGTEYSSVGIAGLSDFTEPMLDILAEVALRPAFPEDRLEDYKYRTISRLPARKTNADSLARSLLMRVLYGETKYAMPPSVKENIEAVTREDLVRWHQRSFVPNGARLTVVGDVDARSLMKRIRALFEDWQPSDHDVTLPPADFSPSATTRVHLIDRPGSQQTMIRFANLAIPRNHPDYIPLVVANRILGAGSTGRLFQKIREEKGYTYGAYSSFNAPKWPGSWGAYASVRTEVTGPAVREFLNEFARIQNEPVSAEELDRAKRTIVGSFARALESPNDIMSRTITLIVNGLPSDYWETYPAKIQAVTAEDVQRVARQYLGQNRIQIIAVGEAAAIEPVLSEFGAVQLYNDDIKPLVPATGGP